MLGMNGKDLPRERIFLSPPHLGGSELELVKEVFRSNYIAPVGEQLSKFEKEFAAIIGVKYAVAVSSGTAGLHLALRYAGIAEGDEVLCSSFTFVASANAILYLGAKPVFIDSELSSWNLDPDLLQEALVKKASQGKLPKAVIIVHLYGQSADMTKIMSICDSFGVTVIEDAAEALGTKYLGVSPGSFGQCGVFSFNGNKIITTSGGGMIVSNDAQLIDKVRFWSTQAKEDAEHYEHCEMGYNYRMSNVLAAIGRGQLEVLSDRVQRKREIYNFYYRELSPIPGIEFMPEPEGSLSSRWLTCITIIAELFGHDFRFVKNRLEEENIETRPLWKPMHLQPMFSHCEVFGGGVSEALFATGLCLPSGTAMSAEDIRTIVDIIKSCAR